MTNIIDIINIRRLKALVLLLIESFWYLLIQQIGQAMRFFTDQIEGTSRQIAGCSAIRSHSSLSRWYVFLFPRTCMTTVNRLSFGKKNGLSLSKQIPTKITQRHQPLYPDSKLPKSAQNAAPLTLLQVETHRILRRARRRCHFCSLPDTLWTLWHLMAGHLGSCAWIWAIQSCGMLQCCHP